MIPRAHRQPATLTKTSSWSCNISTFPSTRRNLLSAAGSLRQSLGAGRQSHGAVYQHAHPDRLATLPIGAYTLFVIPNSKQWTLIVSKSTDTSGAYDPQQDLVRVPLDSGELPSPEDEP